MKQTIRNIICLTVLCLLMACGGQKQLDTNSSKVEIEIIEPSKTKKVDDKRKEKDIDTIQPSSNQSKDMATPKSIDTSVIPDSILSNSDTAFFYEGHLVSKVGKTYYAHIESKKIVSVWLRRNSIYEMRLASNDADYFLFKNGKWINKQKTNPFAIPPYNIEKIVYPNWSNTTYEFIELDMNKLTKLLKKEYNYILNNKEIQSLKNESNLLIRKHINLFCRNCEKKDSMIKMTYSINWGPGIHDENVEGYYQLNLYNIYNLDGELINKIGYPGAILPEFYSADIFHVRAYNEGKYEKCSHLINLTTKELIEKNKKCYEKDRF